MALSCDLPSRPWLDRLGQGPGVSCGTQASGSAQVLVTGWSSPLNPAPRPRGWGGAICTCRTQASRTCPNLVSQTHMWAPQVQDTCVWPSPHYHACVRVPRSTPTPSGVLEAPSPFGTEAAPDAWVLSPLWLLHSQPGRDPPIATHPLPSVPSQRPCCRPQPSPTSVLHRSPPPPPKERQNSSILWCLFAAQTPGG